MKSVMLKEGFGIDHLQLVSTPFPKLGFQDILVKMQAVSLNFVDLLLIKGNLNPDLSLPLIPVSDGAGIIEAIGDQNLNKSLEALRVDGHISLVGFLDSQQSTLDLVTLNLKRAKIHGLSVGSRQDFVDMLRAMSANTIRPIIDKIFPFQATTEAFQYLASGQHFGKVVIEF